MYTFVDFTSQIAGRRGVPCPTNKEVSYTNLVCWLGRDLKNKLLLLLLFSNNLLNNIVSGSIPLLDEFKEVYVHHSGGLFHCFTALLFYSLVPTTFRCCRRVSVGVNKSLMSVSYLF
jgi:hypothetical protein